MRRLSPLLVVWACLVSPGASAVEIVTSGSARGDVDRVRCGAGGDTDGDAICNADDNCPADENPDQGDADADGEGDVCDLDGAPGTRRSRLTVRRESAAGASDGRIVATGVLAAPVSAFTGATFIGLVVDATGAGRAPFSLAHEWAANADCTAKPSGAVRCTSPDGRFTVALAPFARTPGALRFEARFVAQPIDASLALGGPATVAVTFGPERSAGESDARVAMLSECRTPHFGLDCRVR